MPGIFPEIAFIVGHQDHIKGDGMRSNQFVEMVALVSAARFAPRLFLIVPAIDHEIRAEPGEFFEYVCKASSGWANPNFVANPFNFKRIMTRQSVEVSHRPIKPLD